MAALLGENAINTTAPAENERMHPALHSWREELPVQLCARTRISGWLYAAVHSGGAVSQSPVEMSAINPVHQPEWIEVERPFPAFALSIPEAADMPSSYAIRRHIEGGGRKDILTLGEPDCCGALSSGRNLPAG